MRLNKCVKNITKNVVYYKNGFIFAVRNHNYGGKYNQTLTIDEIFFKNFVKNFNEFLNIFKNCVFITNNVIMEKYCTYFCLILGTVFLVMAIFCAWKYFFTMTVCYATAFLTTETREH